MNKLFPIVLALLFFGCGEPKKVYGCTDSAACNFNPEASIYTPNSCKYNDLCNICGGDNSSCTDCNGVVEQWRCIYLREIIINFDDLDVHINAIGADASGKQELEVSILKDGVVIVDDVEQSTHSGEINVSITKKEFAESDITATLGEIVTKLLEENDLQDQLTVFDSTGLAIQDLAAAAWILDEAKRTSIGKKIRL